MSFDSDLPKGISKVWNLPSVELAALWDSIILEQDIKDQLISQALINFTVRGKVSRSVLPLHGVVLLVGEPGTGKTSLARGLANRVAQSFKASNLKLIEVEPHALTSSAMGKTQRAVSELFSQTIAEAASNGPTIVLLDEVETLAVDRAKLSLDANPIDIHRATDAVLVQLDALAEKFPSLLFVATSNFPDAVDKAFTSRCDLVLNIPLPNQAACKLILAECLNGLGKTFPPIGLLPSSAQFDACAAECVGLDGRTLRKVVANALASTRETALNPETVTLEQISQSLKKARRNRKGDGK